MTKLHEVQMEALRRSMGRIGFAFFMEQGLGKTLTSLSEFAEMVAAEKATRAVVLCPNSFKSGWVEEINKHGFKFDPYIFESGSSANRAFVNRNYNRPPMFIVNYEAIRSEATQELLQDFIRGRSCAIYADESIQISTHDSSQTKAAIRLAKLFQFRRILSGKPMKAGPHDYWSQMRFIGLLDGVNYFHFRNKFCKMGGFKAKQVTGVRNEEELADLMRPHSFFARKDEWTDLPPKLYTTREYKLTGEMLQKFNSMLHDFILQLEDDVLAVDAAITKYIKLAQIQAGFVIDEEGKLHQLVSDDANPRLNLMMSVLDDEVTGKVCIPYHHKHSLKLLERAMPKYRPAHISGGMSPDEIDEQKRRFNGDPDCRAILLQTKASKYGHTLLGGPEPQNRCSTMVFWENTYSLDDRSQIEDRIHRHGQTDTCLYIDLVGTPIDKNMAIALQRKEDIFQSLLRAIRGR